MTPDGAKWAPRPRVDNATVKALAGAFRYRYMKAQWDTSLGESSLEFSGPITGVTCRF